MTEQKWLTKDDLEAAQALADAATEGPWAIWHDLDHQGFTTVGDAAGVIPEGQDYIDGDYVNPIAHVYVSPDAEFIAQARTLVPALLHRIRFMHDDAVAVALYSAGYRKTRVITTEAELVSLPGQTVIRDNREVVFEVEFHETQHRTFWATQHWTGFGGDFGYKAEDVTLPVTVIYMPGGGSHDHRPYQRDLGAGRRRGSAGARRLLRAGEPAGPPSDQASPGTGR